MNEMQSFIIATLETLVGWDQPPGTALPLNSVLAPRGNPGDLLNLSWSGLSLLSDKENVPDW